jgi:hypothetical protein
VGAFRQPFSILILGFLLVGCAVSETRSIVAASDIPASRYKSIAIFVENLEETEQSALEHSLASQLRDAGAIVEDGNAILSQQGTTLSDADKARLIQARFDAVLYVNAVEKGPGERQLPNLFHDNQYIYAKNGAGSTVVGEINDLTDIHYNLYSDGTISEPVVVLKTKSDFQDTKSAKQVWTGETIAYAKNAFGLNATMGVLTTDVAKQIAQQLKADKAI